MSTQKDNAKLAAACGLYCGACPVFKATEDRALAEKIAQNMGIPIDRVGCRGCRDEKGHIPLMGEPVCPTYQCCVEQRGLQFCYQCQDFPCLKLAPAADKAQTLPHNTKVYNSVLLQKLGLEKWLQMAPQLWGQYFRGKKARGGDELKV